MDVSLDNNAEEIPKIDDTCKQDFTQRCMHANFYTNQRYIYANFYTNQRCKHSEFAKKNAIFSDKTGSSEKNKKFVHKIKTKKKQN